MNKGICVLFILTIWYDSIALIMDIIDGLSISHILRSHVSGILMWSFGLRLLKSETKFLYMHVLRFLTLK